MRVWGAARLMINPLDLIAKRIVAKGFFLNHPDTEAKIPSALRECVPLVASGAIRVPVAGIYPLAALREAVLPLAQRGGKVLLQVAGLREQGVNHDKGKRSEIGFRRPYVSDGGEEFGAVRAIGDHRGELIIYVENAGDFAVPFDAVESVHSGKVILNCASVRDQRLLPELLSQASTTP